MTVKFYKYQGTGNDFILIDNRGYGLTKNRTDWIEHLCDRRFGIGADGLIYLQEKAGFDFEMVYFNSDGQESSMCGNGGRCTIHFAHLLGLMQNTCRFWAIDGEHEGEILADGRVSLKMKDVDAIEALNDDRVMNTGSPHYVKFTQDAGNIDLVAEARHIRYSDRFMTEGINVNFVEKKNSHEIFVRTYERGVEDETLSCGTGVVASSIAFAAQTKTPPEEIKVQTLGGHLTVKLEPAGQGFKNIYLIGPAQKVFEGEIK